jgi:single-strand DNA-binding protein
MAGSVNKVILVGNLGRDPESRSLQSGSKVVSFSLATSETWSDKASGERKERTQWHRIVIFNERLGEIAERYLRKGSKVYLEGALESRKFTDKDGQERETTEVVLKQFRGELTMLEGRNAGEGGGMGEGGGGGGYAPRERAPARAPAGGGAARSQNPSWEAPKRGNDLDDDIPF